MYCSRSRSTKNKDTCFNTQELTSITQAYMDAYGGPPIIPQELSFEWDNLKSAMKNFNESCTTDCDIIDTSGLQNLLWERLRQVMGEKCGDNETCWIDDKVLMKQLKTNDRDLYKQINAEVFLPKGTSTPKGWLSTTEIVNVMHQYEQPGTFKFLDCVPSDHYDLGNSVDIAGIIENKYSAIVFNLDETHEKGSHWVTLFFYNASRSKSKCNLQMEYFDSTGSPPNKNIMRTINALRHDVFLRSKLWINEIKHQRGNTECGVFCLFYITKRISGMGKKEFNDDSIKDSMMYEYRKFLFRPFS